MPEKLDHDEIYLRARKIGITQARIAKELNRTPTTISRALRGERPVALARIDRFISRLERKAAERAVA